VCDSDACFVEVAGFCQLEYEYCPGHPALPRKGVDCLCGMSHYASRYTGYLKKPESVCTGGLDLTAGTRQYRCPAEVQVSCPPQTDHAQPPPVVQPQAGTSARNFGIFEPGSRIGQMR
jgi:hypothetical protein